MMVIYIDLCFYWVLMMLIQTNLCLYGVILMGFLKKYIFILGDNNSNSTPSMFTV